MSNPVEIIVLCEDRPQALLTRKYLKQCGIIHGVRVVMNIGGSGEQWVRVQYPSQVHAYRLAKARKNTWLIVLIDADTRPVAARIRQLNDELKKHPNATTRELVVEKENIARLIPKRNVETWILALNHKQVCEVSDYKHENRDWDELLRSGTIQLYAWTRPNAVIPDGMIDSLKQGIFEFARLSEWRR